MAEELIQASSATHAPPRCHCQPRRGTLPELLNSLLCPGRLLLAWPQCSQHTPSPGSQNSDCAVVTSSSAGPKAGGVGIPKPAPPPPTQPHLPLGPSLLSSPRQVPGPHHLPRFHNPLRLRTSSAGHGRPDHIRKIPRAHLGLSRGSRRALLYCIPFPFSRRPSYPLRKPSSPGLRHQTAQAQGQPLAPRRRQPRPFP